MTHTLLNSIANENGGGLSVSVTGKYTSVRHERAKIDGKLTAGEAAKKLSKTLSEWDGEHKIKVSAKETVSAFKTLNGYEPEWHHAGFYKPTKGGRSAMGRTFFFTHEEVEELATRWAEVGKKIEEKKLEEKRKSETTIRGFYYEWTHDYGGNYGKKRNFKRLYAYEGSELSRPKNFVSCTAQELECVKLFEGKAYYGWDEPTLSEFSGEKMKAEILRREKSAKKELKVRAKYCVKKLKEESDQERANKILNEMEGAGVFTEVDFSQKNCAWYIWSKFIEGTSSQILFSTSKIKTWINSRKK